MQPKHSPARFSAVLAALLLILAPGERANAADLYWGVASGSWAAFINWTPSFNVPGPSDVAYVQYFNGVPGIASVNSAVPSPAFIQVANGATISVGSSGVLGCNGFINVGANSTGGNLRVNGRFSVSGDMKIGVMSGFGRVDQSAGTVTVGTALKVGESTDTSTPFVGTGTYNLTGGALSTPQLLMAVRSGGFALTPLNATFNLSGTGVANVGNLVSKYNTPNATVVFNQTGGELNVSGTADFRGGTYNLNGGKLSANHLVIYDPTTINFNGGSMTTGGLEIYYGGVQMGAAGDEKLLRTGSLYIQPAFGAAIDVNDNAMVVTSADSLVAHWFNLGFNNGQWNGPGIRSSAAAAAIGSAHPTALGIGFAGSSNLTMIAGQTLNPGDLVIRYTYCGDANMDRTVGLADFSRLARYFNVGSAFATWETGDFNYDDAVNLADFSLMAANFNLTLSPASSSGMRPGGASVPEPATALGLACLLTIRRRRDGR